jgi:hypothetical protein
MATFTDRYPVRIGSQSVELPLVPLHSSAAISLLMTIDRGVSFMATAGADLALELAALEPDIVATNATLGIPVCDRGDPSTRARRLPRVAEDAQDPPR